MSDDTERGGEGRDETALVVAVVMEVGRGGLNENGAIETRSGEDIWG